MAKNDKVTKTETEQKKTEIETETENETVRVSISERIKASTVKTAAGMPVEVIQFEAIRPEVTNDIPTGDFKFRFEMPVTDALIAQLTAIKETGAPLQINGTLNRYSKQAKMYFK